MTLRKIGERMAWNGCAIEKTSQGHMVIDPWGAESREDMTLTEAKAYTLLRQDRVKAPFFVYSHWRDMMNGTILKVSNHRLNRP